jgi:hypothetical protein
MPFRLPRRRSRRLLFGAFVGLVIVIIAGAFAWYQGKKHLADAISEADRLDPGWRLGEFGPKQPDSSLIVDADFQTVTTVADSLFELTWPQWPFPSLESDPDYLALVRHAMTLSLLPERGEIGQVEDGPYTTARNATRLTRLLNEDQVSALRSQLNIIANQLQLIRKQTELPAELLGTGPSPGRLGSIVRAIDALKYDALLRAHDGDLEGAMRNVRSMLHISKWPGLDGPVDPGRAFQMITDDALITLERVLGLGVQKEMDLCQLQIILTHHEKISPLTFWLRIERAKLDRRYEAIQTGKLSFASFRKEEYSRWRRRYSAPFAESFILYSYLSAGSHRGKDLHFMNEAVELSKLPADQQLKASQDLCVRFPESPACRILARSTNIVGACLHHFIMLRCAIAALAAERFRLAKGRWPVSWSEMIPKYLGAAPLDPFDGAPLGLSVGEGMFVAFASGELAYQKANGQPIAPESDPRDLGFRIYEPDQRRQPARPFVFPVRKPTKGNSSKGEQETRP